MYNGITANDIAMTALSSKLEGKVLMGNLVEAPKYLQPEVKIRVDDYRSTPMRAYATDAGADLVASVNEEIYPNEMRMVDTGVSVAIPVGYVGLVCSRSGQGKLRISLANSVGVIDAAYRGNIKVMIVNEGDDPYKIEAFKTKIAQLMIVPIILPVFTRFNGTEEEWKDTDRGANGFGSTN